MMDPNALLDELRSAKSDYEDVRGRGTENPAVDDAADRMRDAIYHLDEWLSKDGFLPTDWNK